MTAARERPHIPDDGCGSHHLTAYADACRARHAPARRGVRLQKRLAWAALVIAVLAFLGTVLLAVLS